MSKQKETKIIGIDLGTTNSVVVAMELSGVGNVIPNLDGDTVTASIVSVAGDVPVVGKIAKQDKFLSPEYVFEHIKRLLGKTTEDGRHIPVGSAADGTEYDAVTLSAEILSYLKKSVEKQYDRKFDQAVITVPAYFDHAAKQATMDAAKIAGFKTVKLIDEPTAAATYYGLSKGDNQKIAVFDFGGGTFDISILDIKDGGEISPIAVDGDSECGGSNIDEAVFRGFCRHIKKEGGRISAEDDLAEYLQAMDACIQAKEILAHRDSTTITVKAGSKRFSMQLTRKMLEQYSKQVIRTLEDCCKRAIEKADLQPSQIDKVVLVGGATRTFFVPEIVKNIFGKEPASDTDPDLAVAKGAVCIAASMFGDSNQKILVDGKSYLASAVKQNPIADKDLCVAALRDLSGPAYNTPLINSGAKLPFDSVEYFTPIDHRTNAVQVKLIDGKPGELSKDFTPFKDFEVKVKPTNKSDNQDRIEIKVSMDEQGLVHCRAKDRLLDEPADVEFNFDTSLSDDDIDRQRDDLENRHEN
jgi:molecular chaperone DnaK